MPQLQNLGLVSQNTEYLPYLLKYGPAGKFYYDYNNALLSEQDRRKSTRNIVNSIGSAVGNISSGILGNTENPVIGGISGAVDTGLNFIAPGLGTAASVARNLGNIAGDTISNGYSNNTIDTIRNVTDPIPIVNTAVDVLGGIGNRLFGSKINQDYINTVNNDINNIRDWRTNATSWTRLNADLNNIPTLNGVSKSKVGSDGIWSNDATKEYNKLNNKYNSALDVMGNRIKRAEDNIYTFNTNSMSKNYLNNYAAGGNLFTNGLQFNNGLSYINTGNTHENNPYEGVPVSINQQDGEPNLVEEGEVIANNEYVFSNRLKVPDDVAKHLSIPRGKTFADAIKLIAKESEELPNDPIIKKGLEHSKNILRQAQEQIKAINQQEEALNQQKIQSQNTIDSLLGKAPEIDPSMLEQQEEQNISQEDLDALLANGSLYDYANGGKIHIKEKNKGKFTESANRAGMGVQEYASRILANPDNYSSTLVKRANFARNAAKWKHAEGGHLFEEGGPKKNTQIPLEYIKTENVPSHLINWMYGSDEYPQDNVTINSDWLSENGFVPGYGNDPYWHYKPTTNTIPSYKGPSKYGTYGIQWYNPWSDINNSVSGVNTVFTNIADKLGTAWNLGKDLLTGNINDKDLNYATDWTLKDLTKEKDPNTTLGEVVNFLTPSTLTDWFLEGVPAPQLGKGVKATKKLFGDTVNKINKTIDNIANKVNPNPFGRRSLAVTTPDGQIVLNRIDDIPTLQKIEVNIPGEKKLHVNTTDGIGLNVEKRSNTPNSKNKVSKETPEKLETNTDDLSKKVDDDTLSKNKENLNTNKNTDNVINDDLNRKNVEGNDATSTTNGTPGNDTKSESPLYEELFNKRDNVFNRKKARNYPDKVASALKDKEFLKRLKPGQIAKLRITARDIIKQLNSGKSYGKDNAELIKNLKEGIEKSKRLFSNNILDWTNRGVNATMRNHPLITLGTLIGLERLGAANAGVHSWEDWNKYWQSNIGQFINEDKSPNEVDSRVSAGFNKEDIERDDFVKSFSVDSNGNIFIGKKQISKDELRKLMKKYGLPKYEDQFIYDEDGNILYDPYTDQPAVNTIKKTIIDLYEDIYKAAYQEYYNSSNKTKQKTPNNSKSKSQNTSVPTNSNASNNHYFNDDDYYKLGGSLFSRGGHMFIDGGDEDTTPTPVANLPVWNTPVDNKYVFGLPFDYDAFYNLFPEAKDKFTFGINASDSPESSGKYTGYPRKTEFESIKALEESPYFKYIIDNLSANNYEYANKYKEAYTKRINAFNNKDKNKDKQITNPLEGLEGDDLVAAIAGLNNKNEGIGLMNSGDWGPGHGVFGKVDTGYYRKLNNGSYQRVNITPEQAQQYSLTPMKDEENKDFPYLITKRYLLEDKSNIPTNTISPTTSTIDTTKNITNTSSTPLPPLEPLPYENDMLRYAPLGFNTGSLLYNLRPTDYRAADEIDAASRLNPISLPTSHISDYRRRNPFDESYLANLINQNAAANARASANYSGGNRAMQLGSLAARDYALNQALGQLGYQSYLANRTDDESVAAFNRATNQYNADIDNNMNLQLANINNNREQFTRQNLINNAAYRQSLRDQRDVAIANDLQTLSNNLSELGKQAYDRNHIIDYINWGILPTPYGRRTNSTKETKKTKKTKKEPLVFKDPMTLKGDDLVNYIEQKYESMPSEEPLSNNYDSQYALDTALQQRSINPGKNLFNTIRPLPTIDYNYLLKDLFEKIITNKEPFDFNQKDEYFDAVPYMWSTKYKI